ncbi:copper chaperone PCu(A)C [Streptomyces sp. NPDC005017]|uniref:copper chaperone PCu(A)C n=1 Tax=Streptomyces sp. NPDC005017 TaxID=3364706 RepID=UPI0036B06D42
MRRAVPVTAFALAGALALAGCGDEGSSGAELSVSGAYMPQPVSDMAAGFLTIANDGDRGARLTSVTSDLGEVTVHETSGQAMREVSSLDVPAHGSLVLESGGSHLMFGGLVKRPEEGQTVSVTLHFSGLDPVEVDLPVKPATYRPTSGN